MSGVVDQYFAEYPCTLHSAYLNNIKYSYLILLKNLVEIQFSCIKILRKKLCIAVISYYVKKNYVNTFSS